MLRRSANEDPWWLENKLTEYSKTLKISCSEISKVRNSKFDDMKSTFTIIWIPFSHILYLRLEISNWFQIWIWQTLVFCGFNYFPVIARLILHISGKLPFVSELRLTAMSSTRLNWVCLTSEGTMRTYPSLRGYVQQTR